MGAPSGVARSQEPELCRRLRVWAPHGEPAAPAPVGGAEKGDAGRKAVRQNGEATAAEERQIGGAQAAVISTPVASSHASTNGHALSESALASEPSASEPPERSSSWKGS